MRYAIPILLAAVAALSSCSGSSSDGARSDAAKNRNIATGGELTGIDAPTAKPAPAAERPALATAATDWPGVEARLVVAKRPTPEAVFEVDLANVGSAPVTIDKYSAAGATVTWEGASAPQGPKASGGSVPLTTDLTATLQPGETASVTATFHVPPTVKVLSVKFPSIAPFENLRLNTGASRPMTPDAAPPPNEKKAEALARRAKRQ